MNAPTAAGSRRLEEATPMTESTLNQTLPVLDRDERNRLNDTQFKWSTETVSHNVDIDYVGRYMLDAQEPHREFDLDRETRRADESMDAYNNRLRALHAKREERLGTTHVDPWNRPVDRDLIDPEVLAVLNERIDEGVFEKMVGANQLEDEDCVWNCEAINDAIQLNVASSKRYTALRPEDHVGPIWNCPTLPAEATDRGSKTSEGGSSQYRTRLDIPAYEKHVRVTTKARRYHGIEALVLDNRGRVKMTSQNRHKARHGTAPTQTPRQKLRALSKAKK